MQSECAFEDGDIVPTTEIQHPERAIDDRLDKEIEEIVERRVSEQVASAVWEAVTRFALETSQHKNPQVTLTAFCFAAGLYVNEGLSITDLAKKLGVTKQALSKRIVKFSEQIGLPPSRGMKSVAARESYRKAHTKTTQSQLP